MLPLDAPGNHRIPLVIYVLIKDSVYIYIFVLFKSINK